MPKEILKIFNILLRGFVVIGIIVLILAIAFKYMFGEINYFLIIIGIGFIISGVVFLKLIKLFQKRDMNE